MLVKGHTIQYDVHVGSTLVL